LNLNIPGRNGYLFLENDENDKLMFVRDFTRVLFNQVYTGIPTFEL